MAEQVIAGGLVTYQGSGFPTLDNTIVETFNRDDIMPEHKQYMALIGYNDTTLLSPAQTFSAKSAPKAMGDVTETGIAKNADMIFAPKKGIYQVEIGQSYQRSKLFTEWARRAKTIAGAPDHIQAELLDVASETRDLSLAYDIRFAEEMVKTLTKGFSITAPNGPGSATPKGKALFDTHNYGVAGTPVYGTWTNYENGALSFTSASADILAASTRLQTLINQLKTAKDDNGKYIKQGGVYKLYVSRAREVFWKLVLNNGSQFSGQGNNAMQENQFLFNGNKVEVVVLDLLGQPDANGVNIGTTDMIFVANSEILKQTKALRSYRLYPLTIESWVNMQTKVLTVDGRGAIGVDHYGAELYLAASTCAA